MGAKIRFCFKTLTIYCLFVKEVNLRFGRVGKWDGRIERREM